jgi:nitrate reductase NapD
MSICSMVVHSRPENLDPIAVTLNQMEGVEVRARDERGKLVVLIDHPRRSVIADNMMEMNNIDGVLNTSLIYEYFEEDAPSNS